MGKTSCAGVGVICACVCGCERAALSPAGAVEPLRYPSGRYANADATRVLAFASAPPSRMALTSSAVIVGVTRVGYRQIGSAV